MSTRLSASTKDMINKAYNTKIYELNRKCDRMKEEEANKSKKIIMNSEPFNNLMNAALQLKEYVNKEYPEFYFYSTIRDIIRLAEKDDEDKMNFGYLDKDDIDVALMDNNEYNKIQEEVKSLTKERNHLLFKLENAPIKSKDYEEAYYRLKEMLNQEQD